MVVNGGAIVEPEAHQELMTEVVLVAPGGQ
jgi:hypothetical protein